MRKIKFLFGVILSTAFILQSCEKEQFQLVNDTKKLKTFTIQMVHRMG